MKDNVIKDEMLNMDDEQLVNQFFAQFKEAEISDNGFSDRVISQIKSMPEAKMVETGHVLSGITIERVLKVLCGVGCILLFIYADGFNVMKTVFSHLLLPIGRKISLVGGEGGGLSLVLQAYIAFLTLFVIAAYNVVLLVRSERQ